MLFKVRDEKSCIKILKIYEAGGEHQLNARKRLKL